MAKRKKPDRGTTASAAQASVIQRLKPGEGGSVLKRLLAAHPERRAEAEDMAQSVLREVSFESVAEDVECALRFLDIDDLNDRVGTHRREYTPSPRRRLGN